MRTTGMGFACSVFLISLCIPIDTFLPEPQDEERGWSRETGLIIPPQEGKTNPKKESAPFPGLGQFYYDPDMPDRILRQARGYRRITSHTILHSEKRRALYEIIRRHPGIDQAGLARISGMNENTLRYHLDRIACEEMVSILTVGKSFHYFENHQRYSEEEQQFYARFSTRQSGRILQAIRMNPGITRSELADMLSLASPTVTRAVGHLVHEGFICLKKDGRYTRHYLPEQSHELICRLQGMK